MDLESPYYIKTYLLPNAYLPSPSEEHSLPFAEKPIVTSPALQGNILIFLKTFPYNFSLLLNLYPNSSLSRFQEVKTITM
jgi:hypothetical protein